MCFRSKAKYRNLNLRTNLGAIARKRKIIFSQLSLINTLFKFSWNFLLTQLCNSMYYTIHICALDLKQNKQYNDLRTIIDAISLFMWKYCIFRLRLKI